MAVGLSDVPILAGEGEASLDAADAVLSRAVVKWGGDPIAAEPCRALPLLVVGGRGMVARDDSTVLAVDCGVGFGVIGRTGFAEGFL